MIDFHCHLDLYERPRWVLDQLVERGCYVLAVTTTPLAWQGTTRLLSGVPRVRVGAGLHPELVGERHHEVARLCSLIRDTPYVGEVGLDGSPRYRGSLSLQKEVLRRVLNSCVEAGGRVLSIHSRGAASAVLDELQACPGAGLAILHWFSGTQTELARATALGCWFSVGPAMLCTERGRQLAAQMPRDRVLTETDGPLAQYNKRALWPWDAAEAEKGLAACWQSEVGIVKAQMKSNLRLLLQSRAIARG